jgi:hypothetical protein
MDGGVLLLRSARRKGAESLKRARGDCCTFRRTDWISGHANQPNGCTSSNSLLFCVEAIRGEKRSDMKTKLKVLG